MWRLALDTDRLGGDPVYRRRLARRGNLAASVVAPRALHAPPASPLPTEPERIELPYAPCTLAAFVLIAGPRPDATRLEPCLATAVTTADPTHWRVLARLVARFGKPAVDVIERLARDGLDSEFGWQGEAAAARALRYLQHLGDDGWDLLRRLAQPPEPAEMRRTALAALGTMSRPVGMDLFALGRLVHDPECARHAAGAVAQTPAPASQVRVAEWAAEWIDSGTPEVRRRLLATFAQCSYHKAAADVLRQAFARQLVAGPDENVPLVIAGLLELGIQGLDDTSRAKLQQFAKSQHELAQPVATALVRDALDDDRKLTDLLSFDAVEPSELLRNLDARWSALPEPIAARSVARFETDVRAAEPEQRAAVARAFAERPLGEIVGLHDALRTMLAADEHTSRRALQLIAATPRQFAELAPDLRALRDSDRDTSSYAATLLAHIDPSDLHVSIERDLVEHPGREIADAPHPVDELLALLDHESAHVRDTAAAWLAQSATTTQLIGMLDHDDRVVRLRALHALAPRVRHREMPPGVLRTMVDELRAMLDEAVAATLDTTSDNRGRSLTDAMDAARGLHAIRELDATCCRRLVSLAPHMQHGMRPPEWTSSTLHTHIEHDFPPITCWDLFHMIQAAPLTSEVREWLRQSSDEWLDLDSDYVLRAAEVLRRDDMRRAAAAAARRWFATGRANGEAPPEFGDTITFADARALVPLLWRARQNAARDAEVPGLAEADAAGATATSAEAMLTVGDYEFPYVIVRRGQRPERGFALFVCLHGGGGNPRANGPHAWSVNTREWQAQRTLAQRVYEPDGLYLVPRMADDRRGRWWHDHNQIAIDTFVDAALLLHGVDPDRVYLTGISEGGYGAIRFAGNRPDRFAAIGGMAAAEPLATSPAEDMRNVAFRIDIGERDTQFDRVGLARRMGARLDELRAEDPDGYEHVVNIQAGRGHGIDYRPTPTWLAEHVRDARPDRVAWTVRPFDSRVALRRHWLALDAAPKDFPARVDARIVRGDLRHQRIEVRTDGSIGRLRIRLDDDLADLSSPITVVANGVARPPVRVERSLPVMLRTLAERADPRACFSTEIVVEIDGE